MNWKERLLFQFAQLHWLVRLPTEEFPLHFDWQQRWALGLRTAKAVVNSLSSANVHRSARRYCTWDGASVKSGSLRDRPNYTLKKAHTRPRAKNSDYSLKILPRAGHALQLQAPPFKAPTSLSLFTQSTGPSLLAGARDATNQSAPLQRRCHKAVSLAPYQ